MQARMAGLDVSFEGEGVFDAFRPFAVDDALPPALVVRSEPVERVDPPAPEYTIQVYGFGPGDDAALLAWNLYEGTALLRVDAPGFDARPVRAAVATGGDPKRHSVLNMVNVAFSPVLARSGGMALHASVVELDGRSVIFAGSSGVGKSTHADLWARALGARILNGDKTLLRRVDGAWTAFGSPWSGSSGYVVNASAPLSGVVLLRQGGHNEARRLDAREALRLLATHVYYPQWDETGTALTLDALAALVREVPFLELTCLPNEGAALLAHRALGEVGAPWS